MLDQVGWYNLDRATQGDQELYVDAYWLKKLEWLVQSTRWPSCTTGKDYLCCLAPVARTRKRHGWCREVDLGLM